MLYLKWLKPHETMSGVPVIEDFGRHGAIVSESRADVGTALYNEAFSKEPITPEKSGVAAGGVFREDENTKSRTLFSTSLDRVCHKFPFEQPINPTQSSEVHKPSEKRVYSFSCVRNGLP